MDMLLPVTQNCESFEIIYSNIVFYPSLLNLIASRQQKLLMLPRLLYDGVHHYSVGSLYGRF